MKVEVVILMVKLYRIRKVKLLTFELYDYSGTLLVIAMKQSIGMLFFSSSYAIAFIKHNLERKCIPGPPSLSLSL